MRAAIRCVSKLWLAAVLAAGHAIASPEFDYLLHCAGCHIEDGSGMPPGIPDLRVDVAYLASRPEGRSYLIRVPGVAQAPISDAAVADVLNWILDKLADGAGTAKPFTPKEVSKHRSKVLSDPIKLREKLLDARRPREAPADLAALGQALFFDTRLSKNGNQSCATCHDPSTAFSDPRDKGSGGASRGSDGNLGDRNAPTLSYVGLIPKRSRDHAGLSMGGFFWDGRQAGLESQALGPLFNSLEMGLKDEIRLAERLGGDGYYRRSFKARFGPDIFSDPSRLSGAAAEALAAFQRSQGFATFDSRYDRYLRGEYRPTAQEATGMALFFSRDFTNCNRCHQSAPLPQSPREIFSNFRYENIGVPVNEGLRQANGLGPSHIDSGLAVVTEKNEDQGRFRVPTLRNVAVTAPYMHNGVFKDLRTVLLFYNRYNSNAPRTRINPESGKDWAPAEVSHTIALDRLRAPIPLDEPQLDALLAFLNMLTDARFETRGTTAASSRAAN